MTIFEVSGVTTVADYFVICSADSGRQVGAIKDHITETLAEAGEKPFSIEGEQSLTWVLMDFSDVVIHVFKSDVRGFYALERLWGDAPKLSVRDPKLPETNKKPAKKKAADVS